MSKALLALLALRCPFGRCGILLSAGSLASPMRSWKLSRYQTAPVHTKCCLPKVWLLLILLASCICVFSVELSLFPALSTDAFDQLIDNPGTSAQHSWLADDVDVDLPHM